MTFAQDLYLRLPAALQNLACTLEGGRIERRRYGGSFNDILREAEARACWSQQQIEEFRDRRLAWFVREVAAKAPFHRRRFREAGVDPERVRTVTDLSALPVLTKREVQEHFEELTPEGVELGRRIVVHTSGTTGGGLRFTATVEAEREQWAVWWRYRRWHGIEQGTWCGYFGGRLMMPASRTKPPFWRISHPTRQILFSGHHMSVANLPAYVTELRSRRPEWLHGYPSLLVLLAMYLLDCGEELGYRLRWVTTGAENLSAEQAALLERAFGVRPRQHYGMAEAVANFSECEQGRLHVDEDFAAVEFLRSEDGLTHRVVGTNLSNPATPLVRYDTGDLVTLGQEDRCPCGRPGRIVERIDGRAPDFLVLRDGRRFGPANHLFKYLVNVREAQIYQRVPGEITVRVVRGAHFTARDEQRLRREISQRLGEGNHVEIEYVETIERGPRGKHLVVVSELRDRARTGIPGGGESDCNLR
jgi:phenylacetate-CoA ligase